MCRIMSRRRSLRHMAFRNSRRTDRLGRDASVRYSEPAAGRPPGRPRRCPCGCARSSSIDASSTQCLPSDASIGVLDRPVGAGDLPEALGAGSFAPSAKIPVTANPRPMLRQAASRFACDTPVPLASFYSFGSQSLSHHERSLHDSWPCPCGCAGLALRSRQGLGRTAWPARRTISISPARSTRALRAATTPTARSSTRSTPQGAAPLLEHQGLAMFRTLPVQHGRLQVLRIGIEGEGVAGTSPMGDMPEIEATSWERQGDGVRARRLTAGYVVARLSYVNDHWEENLPDYNLRVGSAGVAQRRRPRRRDARARRTGRGPSGAPTTTTRRAARTTGPSAATS